MQSIFQNGLDPKGLKNDKELPDQLGENPDEINSDPSRMAEMC
jgi:hypothetical protein